MGEFAIGAVSMIGAPPVAGFLSKWYLCLGSVQSGHLIFLDHGSTGDGLIGALRDYLLPSLRERYGKEGLRRLGLPDLPPGRSPFRRLAELAQQLTGAPNPWA